MSGSDYNTFADLTPTKTKNDVRFLFSWFIIHMAELFDYIENRKYKNLERAINAGADINAVNEDNYTPLTLAISTDDIKYVNLILQAKPDMNSLARAPADFMDRDRQHMLQTPLTYALVMSSRPIIVKALLKAGADPNIHPTPNDTMDLSRAEDHHNIPPLMSAIQNGNKEIIKALINAGVNVNDVTNKGYTPLYAVAFSNGNNKEIILMLLEAGADQNYKIQNKTALEHHKLMFESNKSFDFHELGNAEQNAIVKYSTYGQHLAAIKSYNLAHHKKAVVIDRELKSLQEMTSAKKIPQDLSYVIGTYIDGKSTKDHFNRTVKNTKIPSPRKTRKSRSKSRSK
jgi:ankyrin repeat protein